MALFHVPWSRAHGMGAHEVEQWAQHALLSVELWMCSKKPSQSSGNIKIHTFWPKDRSKMSLLVLLAAMGPRGLLKLVWAMYMWVSSELGLCCDTGWGGFEACCDAQKAGECRGSPAGWLGTHPGPFVLVPRHHPQLTLGHRQFPTSPASSEQQSSLQNGQNT